MPTLQLEALPLDALRRHAQPEHGLLGAAGSSVALRRALCAKLLPDNAELWPAPAASGAQVDEAPHGLTCPISLHLMDDPVRLRLRRGRLRAAA